MSTGNTGINAIDPAARRRNFRQVLEGTHCIYPGSVFDPLSARIAEELGFEVGMFAGSVASLTVLGAPDLIVLTLSDIGLPAAKLRVMPSAPSGSTP